ncbi:transposase [Streptomyces chiangmaiensis]
MSRLPGKRARPVLRGPRRSNAPGLPDEAIGERGPHRLHHLLSRAVWDEQAVLKRTVAWAVDLLDDGDGILIADETGDAKSSTDAVAAARQYSGSVGGVALCQVAVHLTFATSAGHCLIDRRLYFTKEWAADEERRELTGVPDELCFATKPHLAQDMLRTAGGRAYPPRSSWATRSTEGGSCVAPAASWAWATSWECAPTTRSPPRPRG